jgi:monoamine oxidase
MGVLDKVGIAFEEPFWTEQLDEAFLGYVSARPGEYPFFMNLAEVAGNPALMALVGGPFARAMEGRSDAALRDEVMDILRRIFGKRVTTPTGIVVSRWAADPFTHGSYSFVPTGASSSACDAMAEPVGPTLLFAGEATHRRYPATVHGAYLSGVREAERILAAGVPTRPL